MKNREKPLVLRKYETIFARLPKNSPMRPEIQYELAKYHKGYIGEKKVDYYLLHLPQRYIHLRDVYLLNNGQSFQIDNLIITPHAIYIIEVKNYNGKIIFDTILNQFTRDDGEKETGFNHPITQAELQQIKFQNWLQKSGYPPIPIHYFIAISEPATKIKVIGDKEAIASVVARGEHIPKKIIDMENTLSHNPTIQQQKIGHAVRRACREFDFDVMAKHELTIDNLLPGVECPGCGKLGMERTHGFWFCTHCNKSSKNAHQKAISDYLLCSGNFITNKECVRFLKINSRSLATRILQASNLTFQKEHKIWIQERPR